MTIEPIRSGHADVNGCSLYHEVYGQGAPVVLLPGGLADPGWQNTQLTNARLAIIPGYSHYNFHSSVELGPMIARFLAASLSKPQGGEAAAASQVGS